MASPLHCSESYCDLHDYRINTAGICLRQDALRRSENAARSGSPLDGDFGPYWAGVVTRLDAMLERMDEGRQPNLSPPAAPQPPPKRAPRRGGAPL